MNGLRVITYLRQRLSDLRTDERGQALPVIVLGMTALLGMTAFSVDYGRAAYASRVLQSTTDAAALAGAQALPTASTTAAVVGANGVVVQYSAEPTEHNATSVLPNVSVTASIKCLATLQSLGIPCNSVGTGNAVQVTQTSTYPMYFWGIFHHPTMSLVAVSTAAVKGGSTRPANVAIILDTTLSMTSYDDDCGATQMQCALNGVQVLLKTLSPCAAYMASCNASNGVAQNAFDSVALFTFPNVSTATASIDTSCTTPISASWTGARNSSSWGPYTMLPNPAWSGVPTDVAYSFPSASAKSYTPTTTTYQLTPYSSDYRTSDTATSLNSTSAIVKAVGGVSNCGAMTPGNYDGDYGTYYAGAIYAAQASLVAQQALNPGSENIIILLSDGDANTTQSPVGYTAMPSPATSNGLYPSWYDDCGQGITAAKAATAAGTEFYTVAYGSPSTGCSTDSKTSQTYSNSPCDTMEEMASASQMFYSDYNQTGSNSNCYASQSVTKLNDIFSSIVSNISTAHLIPNNTT